MESRLSGILCCWLGVWQCTIGPSLINFKGSYKREERDSYDKSVGTIELNAILKTDTKLNTQNTLF